MTSPRQRRKRLLALKKLKEQAEQTVVAAVEAVVETVSHVVEEVKEAVEEAVEDIKDAVQPESSQEQKDLTLQEKVAARRAARLAKQQEKVKSNE